MNRRRIAWVLGMLLLTAGCATPDRDLPSLRPRIPGATRVDLPEVLGTPVVAVAPEFTDLSLAPNEKAMFDIEFTINVRGEVVESKIVQASHPAHAEQLLNQHRRWIYAVAVGSDPCALQVFTGLQRVVVERRDGRLSSSLEPAQVLSVRSRRAVPLRGEISVPDYRALMERISYPRPALLQGVEGRLALIARFGTDGKVEEVFPVNAAYDQWGFTASAMAAAKTLVADPPPAKPVTVCMPIEFRIKR